MHAKILLVRNRIRKYLSSEDYTFKLVTVDCAALIETTLILHAIFPS